jgi:hypothetical protein
MRKTTSTDPLFMLSKLIPGQPVSAVDPLITEFVARPRRERGMVEKFIAVKTRPVRSTGSSLRMAWAKPSTPINS